jgi:predicted lactoylglutathione lyase
MSVRLHCLTLPVDDLQASILFYRDGLGLLYEDKEDHAIFSLEGQLMVMLLPRRDFASFVDLAGQEMAPPGTSQMILTYFADSPDEVDAILERAGDYAPTGEAADDRAWGYSGYLSDPDGHIWEILYNPDLLRNPYDDELGEL